MMDEQSLKEMQKEELEAIQAIYMDDYIHHTTGSGPPVITLKLIPLQSIVGKDVYARLDLRVQYTTRYPLDAPILNLENEKGISKDQLVKLKKELDNMASDLCGEVMVLQLAQHVQSYLHQFNVPNLSFFEQMMVNQQKLEEIMVKEEEKKREAEVAKDRERDEDVIRQVKEELVKRGEVLKQEKRKRHESFSINSSPYGSPQNATFESLRKSSFSCLLSKERKLTVTIFRGKHEDKKLFCSSCIGHYFYGACCLAAIDELSGKPMTVIDWTRKIPIRKKKVHFSLNAEKVDSDAITKQVQSIEQEFNYLKTKVQCSGLINYHFLDIDQNANSVYAKILMDSIPGVPLSNCLQDSGLPLLHIQDICKRIVDILAFLHNKSVVHRDLSLSNTFMISNNDVVISGYAVIPRISDLCKLVNIYDEDLQVPPNNFQDFKEIVKPGKKGDVFNLGLMLLSLYEGHTEIAFPVKLSEDIPEKFRSFLKSCLEDDESERFTVQQLSKHSFLLEKIFAPLSSKCEDGNKNVLIESESLVNVTCGEKDMHFPIYPEHLITGKSRLMNEFEIIDWIGKGGFGSVIKVRNKLDGNYYAIKRIQLMPKSLYLKRITREVKLLSRLNHENVVRYFNSWIEAEDITFQEESFSELDTETISRNQQKINKSKKADRIYRQRRNLEESLMEMNNINFDDCPENNDDHEISWCAESRREATSSSDSWSDEAYTSKGKSFSTSIRSRASRAESSEGIVFEIEDSIMQFGDRLDSDSDEEHHENTNKTDSTEDSSGTPSIQYLYIQMEFCERSTLRTAIDNGLSKESDRVWRYFREIVEGIAHVHGQGIIHRDLKPINIFMDSYNRIKIGDFGLATSHGTSKLGTPTDSQISTDGASGKVGTILYVAPEVCTSSSRIKISPKVDIYSLGIILFEMLHRPLDTKMERVKVIGMLRRESIAFPADFTLKKYAKEHNLITWLLNHDPELRPTAQDLLESGYIPPKMEDSQLDELLKHTLSQTSSARYKRLMSALFTQPVSPVADQLYDSLNQGRTEGIIMLGARILQYVRNIVTKVFTRHCAVFLEVPLFIPKTKLFDQFSDAARFIDQSGLQLCLPYDSRISFARYISKNNICNLKRFYFGKLYREQKILGAHPAGSWECSYDIVTDTSSSCVPEGEILYTVYEIIKEFPRLHNRDFYVRLNHTSLVKAIFDQTNLKEETQTEIFLIMEKTDNLKSLEAALRDYFIHSNFSEHSINKLVFFLTFEGNLSKAKETFQILRKSRESISSLTKKAFYDIEIILKHLDSLKFDMPVHVCTYLLPKQNHYTEIYFQIVAENKQKRKHGGVDILAAGGCYNNLVESMSKYAETSILPHAVGVSINVEKILLSVLDAHKNESMSQCLSECDVIVCGVSKMSLQILHELWSAGINADIFSYELSHDYNLEDIQDYCKNNGVSHIVILKETDLEFVKLRSLEKDAKKEEKFTDYGMRIHINRLCNILSQKLSSKTEKELDVAPKVGGSHSSNLSFHYLEKLESKERRKYESIFLTKFLPELHCSYGSNEIYVVVAKLESQQVKTIAAFLEINGSEEEYETSVQEIMRMYDGQGRFMKICNAIYDVYHEKDRKSIVILSSYTADVYKIVAIVKNN